MGAIRLVEIPVQEATAAALSDSRRRLAIGRLVDRLLKPESGNQLAALLERTAAEAGLTDVEIEAELAAYNAERRG